MPRATGSAGANAAAAREWFLANGEITHFAAAACDLNGVLRGKRMPADKAGQVLDGRARMPMSALQLDIWGRDIQNSALFKKKSDTDCPCPWTGRGPLPVSWLSSPSALVPLWYTHEDGSPFFGDPRQCLARQVDKFRPLGLSANFGLEMEFYLLQQGSGGKRTDGPGRDRYLSVQELDSFDGLINGISTACAEQGIPVDTSLCENAAGQFEVSLGHQPDPLKAADDALYFKHLAKGVARKMGYVASFMAKPFSGMPGNGMHAHISVTDKAGGNIFDNGKAPGSGKLRHAVGGLLEALPELTAVLAPHPNSFRRLADALPAGAGWGYENRFAAIRIPGGTPGARRIELRVAGADANPYLLLAAVMGAVRLGLGRRAKPPAAWNNGAPPAGLAQLPADPKNALAQFCAGKHARDIFPPEMRDMYAACKRQEQAVFAGHVSEFERSSHLAGS